MRVLRWILPAAVAGLAWWASAMISALGRTTLSGPQAQVLAIFAPPTIPYTQLTAPAPWGPAAVLLSVVGAAAVYAVLTAVIAIDRQPRLRVVVALAAAWFAAVATGAVMGLVATATAFIARGTVVAVGSEPFTADVQWGLAWGWLPAVVVLMLARRAPAQSDEAQTDEAQPGDARRRILVPVVASAVFIVAAVGLVAVTPGAEQAWHSELTASAGETAVETPPPSVEPVPLVAPGDWTIDPAWCTPGQLEFTASVPDAFAGNRGMVVTATNVSGAPCVLESYPDVAFSDILENPLEVSVEHGTSMAAADAGIVRIEVAANSSARFTLGWGAMPTQGLEAAGWLWVAPYVGAERQLVQVDTDITGGEVTTTAWQAPIG